MIVVKTGSVEVDVDPAGYTIAVGDEEIQADRKEAIAIALGILREETKPDVYRHLWEVARSLGVSLDLLV